MVFDFSDYLQHIVTVCGYVFVRALGETNMVSGVSVRNALCDAYNDFKIYVVCIAGDSLLFFVDTGYWAYTETKQKEMGNFPFVFLCIFADIDAALLSPFIFSAWILFCCF